MPMRPGTILSGIRMQGFPECDIVVLTLMLVLPRFSGEGGVPTMVLDQRRPFCCPRARWSRAVTARPLAWICIMAVLPVEGKVYVAIG